MIREQMQMWLLHSPPVKERVDGTSVVPTNVRKQMCVSIRFVHTYRTYVGK
jgi:hypothetical protein